MSDDEEFEEEEEEEEEDEDEDEDEEEEDEEDEDEEEVDETKRMKKQESVQRDVTLIHHIFDYIDDTSRRIDDRREMEAQIQDLEQELRTARELISNLNSKPNASSKQKMLAPAKNNQTRRVVVDPTGLSFEEYESMDEAQRELLLNQAMQALAADMDDQSSAV
jgi:hypothetical protein